MPASPLSCEPLLFPCRAAADAAIWYQKALAFVQKNYPTIGRLMGSPRRALFLIAVALPGIMRSISFSRLPKIDFLERRYMRCGRIPTNYAVGKLQMRLVLAEQIERYLALYPMLRQETGLVLYRPTSEKNMRYVRLRRMQSFKWQLRYLHAFEAVMRHRFGKTHFDDELQKLRFYMTMYYGGDIFSENGDLCCNGFSANSLLYEAYGARFYLQNVAKVTNLPPDGIG